MLERSPSNLTAHERLFRILLEEGEIEAARVAAQAYVVVLDERGDNAAVSMVQNEFLARGERFEPAPTSSAPPSFASESSVSLDEFTGEEEMSFDLDSPPEMEFDLDAPATLEVEEEPEPEPEPEPAPEVAAAPAAAPETETEFAFDAQEFASEPQFGASDFASVDELTLGPSVEELHLDDAVDLDDTLSIEDLAAADELRRLAEAAEEEALERALQPAPEWKPEPEPEPEPLRAPEFRHEPEPEYESEFSLDEEAPVFGDVELPGLSSPANDEPFFGVEALSGSDELNLDDDVPLEEIGESISTSPRSCSTRPGASWRRCRRASPGHPDLIARSEQVAAASAEAAAAAAHARPHPRAHPSPRRAVARRDRDRASLRDPG